ncbi:hypothetical protein PORCRE_1330 [Porphyromonas crevioricanis JCM 15906]|uniref:Uncharacterized protein n=1 Tax=Porphyromonas crevioricanis JCM 15906 TaxID=1305617 RepID=T1DSA2_9PORP|nr:hypothetical protein PORCRE_1330 [Porphyromonas crevioricanis JCM 15906]GAD06511.1 hypothetical protein PORCAN_107 [Porphyromonas crevioricanis JCM 13913]
MCLYDLLKVVVPRISLPKTKQATAIQLQPARIYNTLL